MTYTDIRAKRARDVTDQDVIRLAAGTLEWSGESYRPNLHRSMITAEPRLLHQWREVLGTYHDLDALCAEFNDNTHPELFKVAEDHFNRSVPAWVVLRLLLPEYGTDGETSDVFVVIYRNELVEVQAESTGEDQAR